ncbi:hypothetical protein GWI33_015673 [Rhynchophorus ferrugineus]|uniref:Transcriptional regulator ATRX homolog n=1 Tax=Rhynchophorus ferrugineus TaxID=354439 RepID=A0A834M489_RHYFE|nr:hypothetical protein GWI33_015673 [Rhynchophorus ferrugineus]
MPDDINVEQLLEAVQNALKALESIDDIDSVLKKLDGDNDRKLFKKVKHTLNECYSKVGNVREKVSKAYKKAKVKINVDNNDIDNSISENDNSEKNETKHTITNQTGDSENLSLSTILENETVSTVQEEDTNIGEPTPEDVNKVSENGDLVEDSSTDSDEIIEGTPAKQKDSTISIGVISQSNNGEQLKDKNGDENDTSSESKEDSESEENVKDKTNGDTGVVTELKLPLIKLVDIHKLMEPNTAPLDLLSPKPKKSVTFDSSVIILSSSDEETPKKNPKGKIESPLKSAMRKSQVGKGDSDSKENKEANSSNGSSKKHDTGTLRNKPRNNVLVSDESVHSSDSDSDFEKSAVGRRGLRNLTAEKDDTSDSSSDDVTILTDSGSERTSSNTKRKKTRSPSDDSDYESGHAKRSSKTKYADVDKVRGIKKIRSSRISDRDDDDDDDDSDADENNSKQKRKKKKAWSDDSSEDNPKRNKTEKPRNPTSEEDWKAVADDLPKTNVIIRLPRYKCEDLVELYKCGTKSKSEHGHKGIKLTLKLNKKVLSGSSEDEADNSMKILPDDSGSQETVDTEKDDKEIQSAEAEKASKEQQQTDNDTAEKSRKPDSSKINDDVSDDDNEVDHEKSDDEPMNTVPIDSDSDEDFGTYTKNKKKGEDQDSPTASDDEFVSPKRSKRAISRNNKKKTKKMALISDSSGSEKDSDDDKGGSSSDQNGSDAEENTNEKKPARRRIKRAKDSSSDEEDKSTRKHIRKVIGRDSLSETTKKAEQDEKERKARMAEKQKKYNQIFQLKADAVPDKVVLDFDEKDETPLLSVHKNLVKQLKPHQVQGVKFMWDACFESIKRAKNTAGSGCILAHCMGLGKTLQVITLSHTLLLNSEKTKVEKVMVVCPVNTVLNWRNEFAKWVPKNDDVFEVYELVSCRTASVNLERSCKVREWHENGGVLIIGYNMFRTLTNPDNKTITKRCRKIFQEGLVDPGPDLVVCDEGHLLKNEKTSLSISMNRIKTARRIVLTGTPLQNNLREYWCMVQFIKPNLLGTYKEYLNRFVNPITNGQYTDSTPHDIAIMRRRSHVLHKLLDGVVQRQDYAVLAPYLPPKYEFVLFIQLTEVQVKLYKHYIENLARKGDTSNKTSFLFNDYQYLQRICTHPRVLKEKSQDDREKNMIEDDSEGSLRDFINDDSDENGSSTPNSDSSESGNSDSEKSPSKKSTRRKRMTRAQAAQRREAGESSESDVEINQPKEWWQQYVEDSDLDNPDLSAKMFLLFEILRECEDIGDKILVFSQSLYTLNCIEYFLERIDESTQRGVTSKNGGHTGSWAIGLDYFRLDGSSSCDNRAAWCDAFNNPDNTRARLFLISTKAGGLGINLVAANRVIIFDVSWNPSHDVQSIYRVYRFGQTKPCYIYRFVTHGSMEMKIYERQVTKQAISKRVIDEQQIDRHYSQNDIQELYKTDLEPADRPIPLVPKDVLLGEMLQKYDKTIFRYHEHQSLLENKQDEELNEAERRAAWEEFENEKELRRNVAVNHASAPNMGNLTGYLNNSYSPHIVQMALANIVRKDNPLWSDLQIKGILPAFFQQLQMQMTEGNFSLFQRVQQELALMQKMQAQRQYLEGIRIQQLIQRQQLTNQMLGNMNITPQELSMLQRTIAAQNNLAGGSRDIIELND